MSSGRYHIFYSAPSRAKLTHDQQATVYARYHFGACKVSLRQLSREYGVSAPVILSIVNNHVRFEGARYAPAGPTQSSDALPIGVGNRKWRVR